MYSNRTTGLILDKTVVHFAPTKMYTLPASATTNLDVTLNASRLYAGTYTGGISLMNNTPDKAKFNIPVNLTVTGTADLKVKSTVEFGDLMAYKTSTTAWKPYIQNFYIKNVGTSNAVLTNITSQTETPQQTDASIYVWNTGMPQGWLNKKTFTATEGTIIPGDSLKVEIKVTPTGTTPASGTINPVNNTVTINNASGLPASTILVTAAPIYAPIFGINPKVVSKTASDKTFYEEIDLTVTNSQIAGASDLNYNLELVFERAAVESAVSTKAVKANQEGKTLTMVTAENQTASKTSGITGTYNRVLEYSTDTEPATKLGYGGGYMFTAATQFVAPKNGFNLTHISSFYVPGELLNTEILIEIRAGGTGNINTSKVIHSQIYKHTVSATDNVGGFIEVKLDKNIPIKPNEAFYLTLRFDYEAEYPIGVHQTESVAGRYSYYDSENDQWKDFAAASSLAKYGYMMKAMEENYEATGWVSILTPESDVATAGGGTKNIKLAFNSMVADPGLNKAKLIVKPNDPLVNASIVLLNLYMNQAPVFKTGKSLDLTVDENSVLDYSLRIEDLESDAIILEVSTLNGLTSTFVDGLFNFNYAPDFEAAGLQTFTVTATDEHGAKSVMTVNITVNQTNRAPIASTIEDKKMYLSETENLSISVTPTFSDADGDQLTYSYSVDNTGIVEIATSPSRFIIYQLTAGVVNVTLTATDPKGASVSTTFKITVDAVNGINDLAAAGGFVVYPNPVSTSAKCVFNLPQSGEVTIVVSDILGKIVSTTQSAKLDAGTNEMTINVQHLEKGTYIIESSLEGKLINVSKFIKE